MCDRFAAAGLAHVLAIAGLHVGIIALAGVAALATAAAAVYTWRQEVAARREPEPAPPEPFAA